MGRKKGGVLVMPGSRAHVAPMNMATCVDCGARQYAEDMDPVSADDGGSYQCRDCAMFEGTYGIGAVGSQTDADGLDPDDADAEYIQHQEEAEYARRMEAERSRRMEAARCS